jgi:hypothetical protein
MDVDYKNIYIYNIKPFYKTLQRDIRYRHQNIYKFYWTCYYIWQIFHKIKVKSFFVRINMQCDYI